MNVELVALPVITVICYLVGEVAKLSPVDNRWIPVICGTAGAILGVVGMIAVPEFPAHDYITAIATGIVSGFAATGVNQIGKQLVGERGAV